jgi:DNA-binding transcriptional LysR family regulator
VKLNRAEFDAKLGVSLFHRHARGLILTENFLVAKAQRWHF